MHMPDVTPSQSTEVPRSDNQLQSVCVWPCF